MKKLLAFLLAGAMVIGCLTACGGTKGDTTEAPEGTTAAQEEKVNDEFAAFLQGIYDAAPGTPGEAERIPAEAEAFVDYVFSHSEGINNEQITSATSMWLNDITAAEPEKIDLFEESLIAVLDEVYNINEEYAEDVSILKYANGILSAIEGFVGEGDEGEGDELSDEFIAFMDAIYAAEPGTAGGSMKTEEAAKAFKDYVLEIGDKMGVDEISYATQLFLDMRAEINGDENYAANFQESFNAVVDATAEDETLEGDVGYNQFVNGIQDGIDVVMSDVDDEVIDEE